MLACLVFVSSASMGLVSGADAQGALATATATLNFDLTTTYWTAGHASLEDDDGHYNSGSVQPNFSVNAQVTLGNTPSEEEGTIIITQPFNSSSPTGPYPALTYDAVATAIATTGDASQSASSQACHMWNGTSGFGTASAAVLSGIPGTDGTHTVIDHTTVYPSGASYTDIGMVRAHAVEPEPQIP